MALKKKNKKLIDLHHEWIKTKRIPQNGLCISLETNSLNGHAALRYTNSLKKLFKPTLQEQRKLIKEGYSPFYWASGLREGSFGLNTKYTELRQTIVLFICAIHEEL